MGKWDELEIFTREEYEKTKGEYENLFKRKVSPVERQCIRLNMLIYFTTHPPKHITNNWRKHHHIPMFRKYKRKGGI